MARKENSKQVNVVMTVEESQQLDEYCARTGRSRNEVMNLGRELLMVDEFKVKAPELSGSIDDFITHTNQLLNLFKISIEHGLIADKRAQASVKGQLDAMGFLTETNRTLQIDLKGISEQKDVLEAKVSDQTKVISELTFTISNLKEKLEKAELYKNNMLDAQAQVLELKEVIVDLKNCHADEVKRLQDDQYFKIYELMKASK